MTNKLVFLDVIFNDLLARANKKELLLMLIKFISHSCLISNYLVLD